MTATRELEQFTHWIIHNVSSYSDNTFNVLVDNGTKDLDTFGMLVDHYNNLPDEDKEFIS